MFDVENHWSCLHEAPRKEECENVDMPAATAARGCACVAVHDNVGAIEKCKTKISSGVLSTEKDQAGADFGSVRNKTPAVDSGVILDHLTHQLMNKYWWIWGSDEKQT